MGNVCITPVIHRKAMYAQNKGWGRWVGGVSEKGKVEPENGAVVTDFPRDW
jgi:hypothetical protein